MSHVERATRFGAIVVIWALMLLGSVVLLATPLIASGLVDQYSDYEGHFWTITALLFAPAAAALTLLAIILVLLRRIRLEQLFSSSTNKWVQALSVVATVLSMSFAVIFGWLNFMNTMPPIIGAMLLIAFLLPLAVALVTRTLLGELKKATAATEELEGVV